MRVADIAVIGAGPYGLSISAHLIGRGLAVHTFGIPMESWRKNMPAGMFLKSEGFASNLYAPGAGSTLTEHCRLHGIEYADIGVPVSLETFCDYGEAFARTFVPQIDPRRVDAIRPWNRGEFEIQLSDGASVRTRIVIVAVGLTYARHVPTPFADLPAAFCAHSSSRRSFDEFSGRDVTVIGGGASAIDTAIGLRASGAQVRILSRHELAFHSPPEVGKRSLFERVRYPWSGLGKNWKARFYADFPNVFYRLPQRTRVRVARTALGPAPGWFTKDAIVGKVDVHSSVVFRRAEVRNGRVALHLESTADGRSRLLATDFVVAATGYATDLARIPFLTDVLPFVRLYERAPVLSPNFESSLPGLFFAGASAADSFGPVLRFAFGARFTAERLTSRLSPIARQGRSGLRAAASLTA
ncbi:MAG: NAD(P)-binding domain-containing protein [Candidatus Baltobacteraceae bacterium]